MVRATNCISSHFNDFSRHHDHLNRNFAALGVSSKRVRKKLTFSDVPVQMPQTIVAVKGEGKGDDELGASLEPSRQVVHELNEVGRVDDRDKGVK